MWLVGGVLLASADVGEGTPDQNALVQTEHVREVLWEMRQERSSVEPGLPKTLVIAKERGR